MFGNRIKIFRLAGFEVSLDLSWIIIAVLLTWSLAQGVFPYYYKNLPPATYWWMGGVGALGLFASIILHEFSHSLVARRFGLPIKGITLFIFGGIAEMDEEPPTPKAELYMALAGPVVSILLGGFFMVLIRIDLLVGIPVPVRGVLMYLGIINLFLAGFNLIPAFPLDGGRVLRAVIWMAKNDIRQATKIASSLGSGFGLFLIVLSVFQILNGNFIGAIWYAILGFFLQRAVQLAYAQLVTRLALSGEPIERFMQHDPVAVPSSLTIDRFIEDFAYRYHHRMFPVTDGQGTTHASITMQDVAELPRERWPKTLVMDVARESDDTMLVSPDTDAAEALARMRRSGNSRFLVVDGTSHLVGILTLKDLLGFLTVKMDLDGREKEGVFEDVRWHSPE